MKMKYKIDLNDFCEEIFHEMERVSTGNSSHEFVIHCDSLDQAAMLTFKKLENFIKSQLKEQV
jgi:hypothetical protein